MAYSRNVWQCGDAISTEKLNNIEDGIEEALECCGGSGYDFIIMKINNNDPTVIEGNYTDIYNKVANHEPVIGWFFHAVDYHDAVTMDVFPLGYITNVITNGMSLGFSKTSYNSVNSIYMTQWNVIWKESGIDSASKNTAIINGNP